jgi:Ca2+-binding EF-hand superfamily protein
VDYPETISAKEVRQAAQGALDDLYRVVDSDADGALTLAEARSASLAGVAVLGHQAFSRADGNDDGAVDYGELDAAVDTAMKQAFAVADKNSDEKLSESEAAEVLIQLAERLGTGVAAVN